MQTTHTMIEALLLAIDERIGELAGLADAGQLEAHDRRALAAVARSPHLSPALRQRAALAIRLPDIVDVRYQD